MWFTQVSLRNPVFATMVMVAFVVLGLFSFQRLQVDQFPNIDFPVVVVTTAYPGASPEIVESEVTKKVEEAVNAVAGVNTLTSRSYEGSSVVIIEFQLTVDGRKAADDVREKIGILRPVLRDEVEEPRVLRFDPASRSIWSVAVVPEPVDGKTPSAVELTTWSEQVLKKRLEGTDITIDDVLYATDYVQFTLLPRLLPDLARDAPHFQLRIVPARPQHGLSMLDTNHVELIAGYFPDPAPDLRTRFLYQEPAVCIVREGHPCLRKRWNLDAYLSYGHLDLAAHTRYFSKAIDRNVWLEGNWFLPDYSARPWVMCRRLGTLGRRLIARRASSRQPRAGMQLLRAATLWAERVFMAGLLRRDEAHPGVQCSGFDPTQSNESALSY